MVREKEIMSNFKELVPEFSDGPYQDYGLVGSDENLDYINRTLTDVYGYSHISIIEIIKYN